MRYQMRFQMFAYYLLSVLVLSIFAFRSTSSYLEYPKHHIILLIALPYFIAGIARALLESKLLCRAAPMARARRQLQIDMGLFLLVAAALLCYELFVFGNALHNALKIGVWALIIGYFASIDSALHRMRHSDYQDCGENAVLSDKALPVSYKLSIFLSATVLLVTLATAISAYGYLVPDQVFGNTGTNGIQQEFIVETLFILGTVITLTTRVIFSYSVNLQNMFENQINTLRDVQNGNLENHVPVATEDEFGCIAQYTNRIISQLREKEKIQRTLQQVVSPDIMQKLLGGNQKDLKNGQSFDLAILFCDLRNFTAYAEDKSPDEVIMFLNTRFTKLADIVAEHNGIVNKFVGDAILAVFGVDGNHNYAEEAVDAAFEILMHTDSAVMRDGTNFDIGIGLNCGPAAAGTIGSSERFEYTFIGDSVNTASRLDGLGKRLGYKIIGSASVFGRLSDRQKALFTDLGEHRVRGKSQPVRVYGAVANEAAGSPDNVVHLTPSDAPA
jgi:class 3 adenylate cyclase